MSVRSWGVMWLILDSHPPSSPNIEAYWGKGSQDGWHGRKRSTKGGIFSSGDGRANGHVSVVVRLGLSKCYSPGGVCTGGPMEEEWTRDIASKEGNQEWVKGMMSGSGLEVGGFWRTYQSTPQKKKKNQCVDIGHIQKTPVPCNNCSLHWDHPLPPLQFLHCREPETKSPASVRASLPEAGLC